MGLHWRHTLLFFLWIAILKLQALIATATNLPKRLQRLKIGFPLAVITAADTTTLAAANLKNGDSVQLEKVVGPKAAAAPVNPALYGVHCAACIYLYIYILKLAGTAGY